jgi:hypothetical protein
MVDGTPYTFLGDPDVSGPTLATQKSSQVGRPEVFEVADPEHS